MLKKKFLFLFFIINLLCIKFIFAAETKLVSVNTSVSTNTITIGDRFVYKFEVTYSPDILLDELDPSELLTAFEIKDYKIIGPVKKNLFSRKLKKQFVYTLSTFTLGEYEIPGFVINYHTDSKNVKSIKVKPIKIFVKSIDGNKKNNDILDIKPLIKIKHSIWFYIIILLVILFIGIGWFSYDLYKNNRLHDFFKKEEVLEPAHIIAYRELNNLKQRGFISRGEFKNYYFILTEIIKKYLERRYDVDILDKTTQETYYALREVNEDRKLLMEIRELLEECDLVKFAKYEPDYKTIERNTKSVETIIDKTKIEEKLDNSIGE